MAAHGIPVSAQEKIIRRRKDRFIAEVVPNVLPKTHRRPPVAAATGLPDICQISPALLLRLPLLFSYIKKLLLLQHHAAAPCSSTMQQHHAAAPCSSTMQQHHAAAWCCCMMQQHIAAAPCSSILQRHHATAPCSSTMQQHHAAAPCSSTMQQHHAAAGPSFFYYTYTC